MKIKIGTFVKFKSRNELAIIVEEHDGEYEVYFPHSEYYLAGCYEDDFDVINDLPKDYR